MLIKPGAERDVCTAEPDPIKRSHFHDLLQYGQIDVLDGAFVLIDKTGSARTFRWDRSPALCSNRERDFPRGGASGRHGGDATGLGR